MFYKTSDRTPYPKMLLLYMAIIVCLTNTVFEERIQHGFPRLCDRSTPSALKNTDGISRTFFSSLHSNRLC